MKATADVAVIGGGVIGLALARELACRGAEVVIVERGRTGEEASSAAAGLLTAQWEAAAPSPLFDLALESRELYPGWAAALEEETGLAVGWRRTGVLHCGRGEELEKFLWQLEAGLPVERVDATEIRSRSAARVSPEIQEALFFPRDSVINNRLLVRALRRSLELRGVRILEGIAVTRFRIEAGRCSGVETSGGSLAATRVVDAAGAWANLDPTLPFTIPVEPIRGQIVELADDGPFPIVMASENVYLVPRSDGRVLVGATAEHAGFRKEVTASGVSRLLSAACALVPSLERARVSDMWAGFRPGTPDGLPILGESPVAGLYLATGHFRYGILLAPITALRLADLLTGVAVHDLAPFAPERFAATPLDR